MGGKTQPLMRTLGPSQVRLQRETWRRTAPCVDGSLELGQAWSPYRAWGLAYISAKFGALKQENLGLGQLYILLALCVLAERQRAES